MKSKVEERTRKAVYLLEYEKKKMEECALSLDSLASAFLMESSKDGIQQDGMQQDRQTLLWERRLVENRQLFSGHLKEMAEIIKKTGEESIRIIRLGKRKEGQIRRMLLLEGLILDDFYLLEKENGRREAAISLHLALCRQTGKVCCAEEVAGFLSVLLETRLVPTGRPPFFVMKEIQTMYFQEESRFMVLTGTARAIKENEEISGDNHLFFENTEGDFFALLSDGMGSGKKACEDSSLVLAMTERLLTGGFSEEVGLRMINDVLIVGGEKRNMSTIDLCRINLYNGDAGFIKVGAASSLLRRDGHVEELTSNSLPLGVFSQLSPVKTSRKLTDGDYVFLLSDGVTDTFQHEEGSRFLKQLVGEMPYRRPVEMANYLMRYAISTSKGRVRDDMTVLVIGIWNNE